MLLFVIVFDDTCHIQNVEHIISSTHLLLAKRTVDPVDDISSLNLFVRLQQVYQHLGNVDDIGSAVTADATIIIKALLINAC